MRWQQDNSGGWIPLANRMTPDEIAVRDEELAWLISHERRGWRLINGHIARGGDPVAMAEGTYGALGAYPLPGSLSAVTLSASEQLLIPAADLPIYLPLPVNGILAPQAYRLVIAGRYTTSTSPGTVAVTMRAGNATTSPSLGVSAATAFTASLTNAFWYLFGDLTIQSIGVPGTNSKMVGQFHFDLNSAVGGAVVSAVWGTGGTAASFDSTIAAGTNGGCLTMDITGSATTPTMTVDQVHFMDWN